MRLPSWLRVTHQERLPRSVTLTLELDTTALEANLHRDAAAVRRFGHAARTAGDDMREALDLMEARNGETRPVWGAHETAHPMNQALANHQARKRNAEQVRFAGVLARWHVKGGLAFVEYPTVDHRDQVVQELLTGTHRGIHRDQRIQIALAFMRGWAETGWATHRAEDSRPVLAYHRRLPLHVVQVVNT